MGESIIMNLPVICRNFPKNPIPEVPRENLLQTIDKIFESDTDFLVVEGIEGIGKTTLLSQYAKRHADNALSLFITPISRLSYAPDYLRVILSEQVNWVLYKKRLDTESIDETFLSTQLPILQKRALRNKEIFYFIIDGLHDLPQEDLRIQDIILQEILPIGLTGFRFLISGNLEKLPNNIQKRLSCKSFPLPYFSLDETNQYLKDLALERQILEDTHKMCQGVPEYLASVRRIIQSGVNVQNILDNDDPDRLPDFLAIEWQKVRDIPDEHKKILALIAFGHKNNSIEEIARILDLGVSKVDDFFQNFAIVTIDCENRCNRFCFRIYEEICL